VRGSAARFAGGGARGEGRGHALGGAGGGDSPVRPFEYDDWLSTCINLEIYHNKDLYRKMYSGGDRGGGGGRDEEVAGGGAGAEEGNVGGMGSTGGFTPRKSGFAHTEFAQSKREERVGEGVTQEEEADSDRGGKEDAGVRNESEWMSRSAKGGGGKIEARNRVMREESERQRPGILGSHHGGGGREGSRGGQAWEEDISETEASNRVMREESERQRQGIIKSETDKE
jgi:hypothetical protein